MIDDDRSFDVMILWWLLWVFLGTLWWIIMLSPDDDGWWTVKNMTARAGNNFYVRVRQERDTAHKNQSQFQMFRPSYVRRTFLETVHSSLLRKFPCNHGRLTDVLSCFVVGTVPNMNGKEHVPRSNFNITIMAPNDQAREGRALVKSGESNHV